MWEKGRKKETKMTDDKRNNEVILLLVLWGVKLEKKKLEHQWKKRSPKTTLLADNTRGW